QYEFGCRRNHDKCYVVVIGRSGRDDVDGHRSRGGGLICRFPGDQRPGLLRP
ncbi:MAG: hypothetical protein JWN47_568, partial [Frankiales bacterium]|nr:hypothetical protein [Frankiales bacterium]